MTAARESRRVKPRPNSKAQRPAAAPIRSPSAAPAAEGVVVRARSPQKFPWTPELLALLGGAPDHVVAERLGLAVVTVAEERRRRGIAPCRTKREAIEWTPEMLAALGTDSDAQVGAMLGIPWHCVYRKRTILNIPAFHPRPRSHPQGHRWSAEELALLGKMSDDQVAGIVGLSTTSVHRKRLQLEIPPFKPAAPAVDWNEARIALLGTETDEGVAARLGISRTTVKKHRSRRRIAASRERRPVVATEELVGLLPLPLGEIRRRTGLKGDTIRGLQRKLRIKGPSASAWRWSAVLARLGKEPDRRIAAELGVSPSRVVAKRRELGVASPQRRWRRWTEEEITALGTAPDVEVARRLQRSRGSVFLKREALGIPRVAAPRRRRAEARTRVEHAPLRARTSRPWRADEIALVGTLPDAEVAARIGRSIGAVQTRRRALAGLRRPAGRPWRSDEVALLGRVPDAEAAAALGRSVVAVTVKRRKMGIRRKAPPRPWGPAEIALLGRASDAEIAAALGRTSESVRLKRSKLGIPRAGDWKPEEIAALGTAADEEVAALLGRGIWAVRGKRYRLGISRFDPTAASRREGPPVAAAR